MRGVAAALLLAACAAGGQPAGTGTAGPGHVTAGGSWNSGPTLAVIAKAEERGGKVAVCGAWTKDYDTPTEFLYDRQVLEIASAELGGERLVSNLGFFPRVPWAADLTGAGTGCAVTGTPWRAGFAAMPVAIVLPRVRFADDPIHGDFVVFSPGAVPALVP